MTQRIPRRSRLVSAIRAALRPSTATAAAVTIALATAGTVQAAIENGPPGKQALRPENLAARDEILFIDAHVVSPEKLLVGTRQGVETVILEEGRDGLEQITEVLESRDPVAVHIVAHGEAGRLQLGDTWLDAQRLDENVALIRRWFGDSNKADLLLYACKLAEGAEGIAFVEKFAEIAGADVAASDDVTGIDGDWDLEFETGDIEADLAFSEITIDRYPDNLGGTTFTVNTTNDNLGGTESCDEYCTLRDAIEQANENGTSDTIVFDLSVAKREAKGTTYVIDIDEQFYISEPVTINGPGINNLAIDAGEEDHIFDIYEAGDVTITDMTLRDGTQEEGGCIESDSTTLTLDEIFFYECTTDDWGGALFFDTSETSLTVRNSAFDENFSEDAAAAIFFRSDEGGSLLVENTDFTDNYADDDGGGEEAGGGAILAYGDETSFTIRDSYFYGNYSEEGSGGGAAFIDEEGSTVLVENSDFYNNAALEESAGGGALFFYMDNTEITVRDSNFVENYAGYYGGGAILLWDDTAEGSEASEIVIENSYFGENYSYEGNAEEGGGGAIRLETVYGSQLAIRDSEFNRNSTEGYGGAISADGDGTGSVTISDSFFVDNYTMDEEADGGAVFLNDLESVTIYASTFYDNVSGDHGGALFAYTTDYIEIINSTFSNNYSGDDGGAMFFSENEYVAIRHTTVVFNEAVSGGGGITNEDSSILVENSIVSDNYGAEGGPDLYGDEIAVMFSLVSDLEEAAIEDDGGNIFYSSADLGPLTFEPGVDTPVHIPNAQSPVLDAGDPGFTPPPDFDQRDQPRVQGGRTDMGAVEGTAIDLVIPTLSRLGMMLMGLTLGLAGFLGLRRRKESG